MPPTSDPQAAPTAPRAYRAAAGQGDRLRTELLDAAEAQLVQTGSITAVSLRRVARAVGVSPTSVYLHFEDKDALLLGVCSRRFEAFAEVLATARAAHAAPVDQLLACGRAYVRFGLEHPEAYKLLFGSIPVELVLERLPPEERVGFQALAAIAEIVASAAQAGQLVADDPEQTAVALWALVHGIVGVVTHGHDQPIDVDALTELALQTFLRGLRP